jgi:hypothetical protein
MCSTIISSGPNGPGNGDSQFPVLSADGNIVVFISNAQNLVPGKTTTHKDIFVVNRSANTITRLLTDNGSEPDGDAGAPNVTPDGHYVVFTAFADNYITALTGTTGGFPQVYRYSISGSDQGTVSLVSAQNGTAQTLGNGVENQSQIISDDGNIVAFESSATNLVASPANTNTTTQIFVRNISAKTTTMISVDPAGTTAANGVACVISSISADGNLVSFESDASNIVASPANPTNIVETYVRNIGSSTEVGIAAGTSVMESLNSSGQMASADEDFSWLSPDGTLIALSSEAKNLVANDNSTNTELFVHNIANHTFVQPVGSTIRVSQSPTGSDPNGPAGFLLNVFSLDDRFAAFISDATNLGPTVAVAGNTFVSDLSNNSIDLVDLDMSGNPSLDGSDGNAISRDGSTIAFDSDGSNLPASNGHLQVYVHPNPLTQ